MQDSHGATNYDLQRELGDVKRDLGRVEGKVDGILAGIIAIQTDNIYCANERHKLGEKINDVKNRQYWFSGAVAGVSFLAAKLGIHFPSL